MATKTHIVGAGVTGLGAAHFLARKGEDCVVHEASDKPGGRAGYHMWEGECLEYGGKNYASDWRLFGGLIEEFGLSERDRQHPNFHIVLNDRLIGLEKKQTLSSGWALLNQIGLRASLEFRQLMATAKANAGALNYSEGLIEEIERRHDDAPIASKFHRNLAYGPLRMFSIIMGAAEPEETYVSQIMLFLASFGKGSHHSVTGGISRLFDALVSGKDCRFGERLTRIEVSNGRLQALHFESAGGRARVERCERAIVTLPLNRLVEVIDLPDDIRAAAARIRYFPLALINAVYDRDVFSEDMNSIMFDQGSVLGHCSANRMYQRNRVRFTLSGAAARPYLASGDEALIMAAEQAFRRRHPIEGKLVYAHVQRHLGGICAYAPRFTATKRALLAHFAGIEGLEIAGDYLEGHNMEGCLTSAELAVARLGRRPMARPAAA